MRTNKSRKSRRLSKSDLRSYLMLSPYLFFFSLSILIPIAVTVLISFTNYNMFQFPSWAGLSNYIQIFVNDEVFIKSLMNTLIFAIVTGPVSYILCFLLAWIINDLPPGLRAFMTLVFYAPSICGSAYVVWSYIFSPDATGIANGVLLQMNIITEPLAWFQDQSMSLILVIVVQIWLSLGIGFLAFIAGLQNIDKSMYEAGMVDGISNRWQELIYITLPAMKPMLLFGGITQITAAFSAGDVSRALSGFPSVGYATHTLALHSYDYGAVRYEMGYAAAVSVVLFIMILFTYKLFIFLLSRIDG